LSCNLNTTDSTTICSFPVRNNDSILIPQISNLLYSIYGSVKNPSKKPFIRVITNLKNSEGTIIQTDTRGFYPSFTTGDINANGLYDITGTDT
jgi:hypothetical protein